MRVEASRSRIDFQTAIPNRIATEESFMNTKAKLKNKSCREYNPLLALCIGALLCLATGNTTAQVYTILHNFNVDDGSGPGSQLVLSGATLYGTTSYGGSLNKGTLFRINTDGSGYTVLKEFSGSDGTGPEGSLVLSGTKLYGTTYQGGSLQVGTVYKVDTDGGGFALLRSFINDHRFDGFHPAGGLISSDTMLYGTTFQGGHSNFGTIFKIGTDGTGYTLLKEFKGNDGKYSYATLVLSGATLYGTTAYGGSFNKGTVFRINTDGSDYTVLKEFSGSDGTGPEATMVLSGTTLYGTTAVGGSNNLGTVFKINTDGSGFSLLKSFTGSDGMYVKGLSLSGTTLYGIAEAGGAFGAGTLFQVSTDGNGFTVLKQFRGSDGGNPTAAPLVSGTTLYGAASGGSFGNGVVYRLALVPPEILRSPQTQTAEVGSEVWFRVDAAATSLLTYRWLCNETNLIKCDSTGSLELTNVQFADCGTYTVVVTNIFGAVTSAPVMLNVIGQVPRRPVPAMQLVGDIGSDLHVEYTDVLGFAANWLPLDTVTLTNPPQFSFDVSKPLPPQRFYRAWQSGTPVVVPSLQLPSFVPAITLTGSVGDKLRLDYINAVGPTDAWVTLDTITLSNPSQLYFDVSAPGQPRRLYRIVPVP
jgi:uncharacterized repeat protein (TIGR03803 family)